MEASRARYLESLSLELRSQATRVRDLIGPIHWGVDGAHKEALLRGVLARHMPAGLICARGFVLGNSDAETSTEQDILIVDTRKRAPVFYNDIVLLATPETVVASISVKTRVSTEQMDDAIKGLNSLLISCSNPWLGVLFFDDEEKQLPLPGTLYKNALDSIVSSTPSRRPLDAKLDAGIDIICTMQSTAIVLDHATSNTHVTARGFNCSKKAPAVFLARLLDHIARFVGDKSSWVSDALDASAMKNLTPAGAEKERAT